MIPHYLSRWFALFFLTLVSAGLVRAQAQFAGTYTGILYVKTTSAFPGVPAIESGSGFFSIVVSATGSLSGTNLTGTVNASGAITFATNSLGLTTGTIASNQLTTPYGSAVGNGVLTYRLLGNAFIPAAGGGSSGGGGTVLPPTVTTNPIIPILNIGASITFTASTSESSPTWQWEFGGKPIAGATSATYTVNNVQTTHAGIYEVALTARGQTVKQATTIQINQNTSQNLIEFTAQPASKSAATGGSANFAVTVNHPAGTSVSYQWVFNGTTIQGANATSYTVANVQPASAGVYTLAVAMNGATTFSAPAILGVTTSQKIIGTGIEFTPNIPHANGNTYDQLLLNGGAASFTADAGQVSRCSFVDANGDIVQIEFGGAGTLTVTLDGATGPAVAAKYNQPSVQYMKGTAKITIVGADETSNLSVFTVGTQTAVNQTLFPAGTTYDGIADIGLVSISSPTGRFGGLRLANTGFIGTSGPTGVYAPDVRFSGPVYVHDITASNDALPVLVTGQIDLGEVLITGGNLAQINSQPLAIGSAPKLRMGAGSTSHGIADLPAQSNAAVIQRNGVDVTSSVIVGP